MIKPKLGEIRTGKELGYISRNKHIGHACEICGKLRWVRLIGGKPQRTKCEAHNGGNYVDSSGNAAGNFKHGFRNTRLYRVWKGMKQRCYLPTFDSYKTYGARGIKVCDEWHEFIPFKDWALSHGYSDDLCIDRIDNDGNYEPDNCQFLTRSENSRKQKLDRLGV